MATCRKCGKTIKWIAGTYHRTVLGFHHAKCEVKEMDEFERLKQQKEEILKRQESAKDREIPRLRAALEEIEKLESSPAPEGAMGWRAVGWADAAAIARKALEAK